MRNLHIYKIVIIDQLLIQLMIWLFKIMIELIRGL